MFAMTNVFMNNLTGLLHSVRNDRGEGEAVDDESLADNKSDGESLNDK